ncbi:GNAT family N-acetyltransferase [Fictibacillus sp. 5RED26]|uniref:GNAT family N-acetyltransferase n=1 Tax=unclassified Fictibacillus TaxID=2644029 RepID=UPI0018CED59B|nr:MULTISPECIES: GNAT family N-acetyltransferase [unclassified Fictibacillus]MBH0158768.1 GNAT family N-acetyltransferase [Fictibacillus sp. 5RED26]MBH0175005.1 GNAT family N-acetyltransferase [Fictibacillus sp. 23RED33]
MGEIRQLSSEQEVRNAFPVMNQLRTHLSEDLFYELFLQMEKEGYTLFANVHEGKIVAVAGFAMLTNLYDGKHIYLYDLITDSNERSKGYGEELLAFLESFALQNNCNCVALSSNVDRKDAHRFYTEKMNYEMPSYVFKKRF